MASRKPRRSHRPRVLHISSDENELMASFPISSNLPIISRTSPRAATTDELSIRGQRPTKAQLNPVRAIIPFTLFCYSSYSLSRPLL
ncbi:hypothetical protein V8E54_001525 [Elaphomyces granulatus]